MHLSLEEKVLLYTLLISVVVLLIFELKLRQHFAAPSVLLLLSCLMASSFIFINRNNWDVSLSFKFFIYVITAILSFILSTYLVQLIFKKDRVIKILDDKKIQTIARPRLSLAIMITIAFVIYSSLYVKRVGFSSDLTALLSNAYSLNVLNNGNSGGFMENQTLKIITGIAYISTYQFLLQKFIVKLKLPQVTNFYNIIVFFLTAILSTDRNILLRFFIYTLVLWILFFSYVNSEYVKNISFKIVSRLLLSVGVILLILYLVGKMKGYTSDFSRSMGLYAGSGLNNFNLFLNNVYDGQLQWGGVTFKGVKGVIDTILGNNVESISFFDEVIAFRASTGFVYISNIYSAMRPFVLDFGYFGVIFFPMLMGIIFEILFSMSMRRRLGLAWIIYAALIYPVIYFFILEQFFSRIHFGSVYEILWIIIFYLYVAAPIKFKLRR